MSEKKKSILDSNLFECFKPIMSHGFEDSYGYKQESKREKRKDHDKAKHNKEKPKDSIHLSTNRKCPHCDCCAPCTIQKIIILNPCSCLREKYNRGDFRTSKVFQLHEIDDD